MSNMSDIMTAILADVTTAISPTATSVVAVDLEHIRAEQLPFVRLQDAGYRGEPLDYRQIQRRWGFVGVVVQEGGTRETMATKLEAIRDQIESDPTLGGTVDYALFSIDGIESGPEEPRIYGVFGVEAQKVV